MTTTPSEPGLAPGRLERFDRTERTLHWANAVLFAVLMATAAVLYVGPLSAVVGRRQTVRQVHTMAGLALPLPWLAALCGRRGRRLRADIGRLNRWDADDWRWLRSRGSDPDVRLGKFNPGQKLNAAFTAGAIVVLLATGSVMKWFSLFPVDWRTGSTFVHDWMALLVFVAVTIHVTKALSEPVALQAMVRGWVPAAWARRHRPRWWEEAEPSAGPREG